jgi:uncharacterized protein (TIGR02271 family)
MEQSASSNPSSSLHSAVTAEDSPNVPMNGESNSARGETIPVFGENVSVQKKEVVTGKINIKKSVHEEVQTVNTPVMRDEYEIVRVPVQSTVLQVPPEPVRHEGDTMIIPVVREITVVEKRYEVIEERHIRHHKTESISTQQITLKKEQVDINREG